MKQLAALILVSACWSSAQSPGEDSPADANDADAGMSDDDAALPVIDAHCDGRPGEPRVLVYTRSIVYDHESADPETALLDMCETEGFSVTVTADSRALDRGRLAHHDVMVLALASGNVFDRERRPVIESWIRAGGGVVGLHSATTISDWPFWRELMGATFLRHPPISEGRLTIEQLDHPVVHGMPLSWTRTDEWYTFDTRPEDNAGMTMLISLDERSLGPDHPPEDKVGYHPLVWSHEMFGGRVVQSSIGHTAESYRDATYLQFVANSIRWAARK